MNASSDPTRLSMTGLTNENIDLAAAQVEEFLAGCALETRDRLRLRLTIEETLLKYQEALGPDAPFSLKCVKRLGRTRIELTFPGEQVDPALSQEETDSEVLRGLLAGMGMAPSWQYKNGVNLVTFTPPRKKPSQIRQLLGSIALAVVCGLVGLLLPENIRLFLSNDLVSPLFGTFMGLLSAVAGPMIFLSVAWGIYSIGDTATLGRIGKRMIGRFLLISLLVALVMVGLFLPFFPLSSAGGSAFNFRELFQMVLDIVPGNFFTPFTEGNPLQIIFVAVLIGLGLLILGSKVSMAAAFVEQSNYIVQLIMEAIGTLVPFFVFGSIFTMILSGDFAALTSLYKWPLLVLMGVAVVVCAYLLLVCVRKGVRPGVLVKKLLPTFLIALSTASSSAAFATNVECCEKELGIDKKVVNFGVPLGQVVFMPGAIVLFFAAGLCMAQIYGVEISPSWLVSAVLISVVLAVAAPPVPGGALTCYTILFAQLGIPTEAIAVAITLNIVMDFLATAVNLLCLQVELVELAGDLKLLDIDALRRRK